MPGHQKRRRHTHQQHGPRRGVRRHGSSGRGNAARQQELLGATPEGPPPAVWEEELPEEELQPAEAVDLEALDQEARRAPPETASTWGEAAEEEARTVAAVEDLSTPDRVAPLLDQHRMNHPNKGAFCGLATVIMTLEANGRGEWNVGDRSTLESMAAHMYIPGNGSSGAKMASYLRKFGEENASFTTGGSLSTLMKSLRSGKPVPVGFVSMGGEVVEAPRSSARYGDLPKGARHWHQFGPSGHWAVVVGFEGPASSPTHFLVNDPDAGVQLRLSRAELERHTRASEGIWMIPY